MASRVNTKFVLALAAGVLGVSLAVAAVLVYVRNNSGELHAAKARELVQQVADLDAQQASGTSPLPDEAYHSQRQQLLDQADRRWDRAIADETQNTEWLGEWARTLEMMRGFRSVQDFFDRLRNRHLSVLYTLAVADSNNPASWVGFVRQRFDLQQALGYQRESNDQLIAEITSQLERYEPFADTGSVDPVWLKLKLYRARLRLEIKASGGLFATPAEWQQVEDDLRAVLAGDPTDHVAALALHDYYREQVSELLRANRNTPMDRMLPLFDKAREALVNFLDHADNRLPGAGAEGEIAAISRRVAVQAALINLSSELARLETLRQAEGKPTDEIIRLVRDTASRFITQLDEVSALLARAEFDGGGGTAAALLMPVELLADADGRLGRMRGALSAMIERRPTDTATAMMALVRLQEQAGLFDDAVATLEELKSLPRPALSIDGFVQLSAQQGAPRYQALLLLTALEREKDEARRADLLTRAKALVTEYRGLVELADPSLLFLDGRVAAAEGRFGEALRLFQEYNAKTADADAQGLRAEARMAARDLDQLGIARKRLGELMSRGQDSVEDIFLLAEIERRLNNFARARELIESTRVRGVDPARLFEVMQVLDRETGAIDAGDPEMQQIRLALNPEPGKVADRAAAIELLSARVKRLNYPIEDVQMLANLLLVERRLDQLKVLARESVAGKPDDAQLAELMAGIDRVEAFVDLEFLLIDRFIKDPAQNAIARARVLIREGRTADADAAMDEAGRLAPNDVDLREARFVRYLTAAEAGDQTAAAKAEALVPTNPQTIDERGIRELYLGRLAMLRRDFPAAERSLDAAMSLMVPRSEMSRLLAAAQRAQNKLDLAVATLRRAIERDPRDVPAINELIGTHLQAGQTDAALDVAERNFAIGRDNRQFIQIYLALQQEYGGVTGRAKSIPIREALRRENPGDRTNTRELAQLYIDARDFERSKPLLDDLMAADATLADVTALATWYVEQGSVRIDDATAVRGIDLAVEAFTTFQKQHPELEGKPDLDLVLASFLLDRDEVSLGLAALERARGTQDPKLLQAERLEAEYYFRRQNYDLAARAIERLLAADADLPEQRYRLLLVASNLNRSQFAAAREAFAGLKPETLGRLETRLYEVAIAGGLNEADRARALMDKVVADFPNEPLAVMRRAEMIMRSSDDPAVYERARLDIERALQLDPSNSEALELLARMYARTNRSTEATATLERLVTLHPERYDIALGLVLDGISRGQNANAIATAQQVLRAKPEATAFAVQVGDMFLGAEQWREAGDFYNHAWTRNREPGLAIRLISTLLNQTPPDIGRANDVLGVCRAVGMNIEANLPLLCARAEVEAARNDRRQADATLAAAYRLAVESARMENVTLWRARLAKVYANNTDGVLTAIDRLENQRKGESGGTLSTPEADILWIARLITRIEAEDKAVGDAAVRDALVQIEAIQTEDVKRLARQVIGDTLFLAKKYDEADRVWAQGLNEFPNDWQMLNNRAYILARYLGRAAEAKPLALRAVEIQPDRGEPQSTLGYVLIELGELEPAGQALAIAETRVRDPRNMMIVAMNRVRLHVKQGKLDDARRWMRIVETVSASAQRLRAEFGGDLEALQQLLRG